MVIIGIKMGVDVLKLFKVLVEVMVFGVCVIIECFCLEGVFIELVVVIGGILKKFDYVMQICVDVWNCFIDVLESEQSCVLGVVIMVVVVVGEYLIVVDVQVVMVLFVCKQYLFNFENVGVYDEFY